MGEPAVDLKTDVGAPHTKKVRLDRTDAEEGAPDVKKVKLDSADAEDAKKVKLDSSDVEDVAPDTEKVKLDPTDAEERAPDIKKVKLDSADVEDGAPDSKKLKLDEVQKQNGNSGEVQTTAEERGEPCLETAIVGQVEYYFGNVNLPKDKFLQEQIKLEDGWVPLDVMLRFQRLANLSRKPETIVSCLRNSSSLMEVNEDGTKIRRSTSKPLPERNEEWQKQVNERTIYCKGFPQDEDRVGPYIEFFKTYGTVEHVNLRKFKDRVTNKWLFKGSVYVLFENKEQAEKFIALESVAYKGTELIRMTQDAHLSEKKKEKDERWGKKLKKTPTKEEESTKIQNKKELAKGCVLKVADITNDELTREEIKSVLTDLGADVGFIEFNKGDKEALIRLKSTEDGAATEFVKKLDDSKLKFGEEEFTVSVLEGDEENAYLEKTKQSLQRFQKGHKGRKQHFNRSGRGGFKGHRRGRSPANE